jgi:hypothetical protein
VLEASLCSIPANPEALRVASLENAQARGRAAEVLVPLETLAAALKAAARPKPVPATREMVVEATVAAVKALVADKVRFLTGRLPD